MRRRSSAALLAGVLLATSALAAEEPASLLGAAGEVYEVQRGVYKTLFPKPPAGWGDHVVLALDIVLDGKRQRVLVPGTDGPEEERAPALAIDRDSSRGFLVWSVNDEIDLIGFSADGWGEVHEVARDLVTAESHPQLATTVDRYQRLDADGATVWASRTVLHLVWYEDGAGGQRVLYTPLVVKDGEVIPGNRILDLAELASEGAAGAGDPVQPARPDLLQRPQVVAGRDQRHVVIGFVSPASGELVTLEVQSLLGELSFFGDWARAVVIDTGHRNPGASPRAVAGLARAVVIDTGRRLLRAGLADLLSERFLGAVETAAEGSDLQQVAEAARTELIRAGIGLRLAAASQSTGQHLEIGAGESAAGASHLLELRRAARRALPPLPEGEVRMLLSSHGDEAALAWSAPAAVRYRETLGDGWSTVRSLALGPELSAEQAYRLIEQRLASR